MATTFQSAVWKMCKKIPKGKVSTYAEIAGALSRGQKNAGRAIAKPHAARAVGNALNKNPYPPEIPCHRVIKSDGSVGGYAYGTRKKIKLLRKEGILISKNRVVGKTEKNKKKIKIAKDHTSVLFRF